jgi:hypothetical protein
MPAEIKEEVNYRVNARLISIVEEKNFVVCEECYNIILWEFPEQFV